MTILSRSVLGIADASVDAAIIIAPDQTLLHFNRAFTKLVGQRARDLGAQEWKAVCHELVGLETCHTDEGCFGIRALRARKTIRLDEVKTGKGLRMIVTASPLLGDDGTVHAILETYRDVTAESRLQDRYRALLELERHQKELLQAEVERRTKELSDSVRDLQTTRSQLIQSEKMSSLGQLVAGIAHELNNPVNFIYGNTDILEEHVRALGEVVDFALELDLPPGPRDALHKWVEKHDLAYIRKDLPELVVALRTGSERIASIVTDLRSFSRMGGDEFADCDLNAGIKMTLHLLGPKAKGRVKVYAELNPLPLVRCNGPHINQVVMNLVANAIDAISGTGTVVVRSRVGPSATVVIEVVDDGVGIDPATLEKIFDPFFTTKEVGKGTGLGLSISFQIMKSHKGRIEVESSPGKGSSFRVILPVN